MTLRLWFAIRVLQPIAKLLVGRKYFQKLVLAKFRAMYPRLKADLEAEFKVPINDAQFMVMLMPILQELQRLGVDAPLLDTIDYK